MSNVKIYPLNLLVQPIYTFPSSTEVPVSLTNISAASDDPAKRNLVKYFNALMPVPLFVGGRLEWSPNFGAYIYWTNDYDFNGTAVFVSYEEFGNVDKSLVKSVSVGGDEYYRFAQYNSISGYQYYPNLGDVSYWYNNQLLSIDLSSLNVFRSFFSVGCDLRNGIVFPSKQGMLNFNLYYTNLHTLNVSSQPTLEFIGIEDNLNLTSVNFDGHSSSITNDISIYENPKLSSVNVPLDTVQNLYLYDNALTSYTVSGSHNLNVFEIDDNFLTSLNIDDCPNLAYIYAYNNILSTETVDNLFISASNSADANNLNYGYIDLSGANGLPSSASAAARDNLATNRSWSVYYSQYNPFYYSPSATDPNIAAWSYTTASNGAGDNDHPAIYSTDVNTVVATPNIKSISIDGLTEIDGYFNMDGDVPVRQTLESINFNNLVNLTSTGGGNLYIDGCSKLTSVSVTGCTSVTSAYINYNYALTHLNLSGSNNITSLDLSYNFSLASLDLSNLTALQYFDGSGLFNIESFNLTSYKQLQTIYLDTDPLYTNPTSIDVSGLTSLNYLSMNGHSKITSLNISGCTSLSVLSLQSSNLTELDLTAFESLTNLYLYHGKLISIKIPVTSSLNYIDLSDNQLSSASINKLLVDLVTAGASNGYVDVSGNFISGVIQNAVVDSTSGGYDGLSAITTLVSRGWTVYYNN